MPSNHDSQTTLQRLIALWKLVPGGALLFAVVPLILLTYLGWYHYGAEHIDQAFYAVRKEQVTLSPQPPWIRSSVLDQVFVAAKLDRLSLLDPSTSATIAQAFDAHPWIKSTTRVTKGVGGKVAVDVVYRRPLAMVYYRPVVREPLQAEKLNDIDQGFYPVDEEGILLPIADNFSEQDITNYLLIRAEGAVLQGNDFGTPFGDARITEALKLCALLEPVRELLQLQWVEVERQPGANGRNPLVFRIITTDALQVRWGHAPQAEGVGEPTVEQKLTTLAEWLKQQRASPAPSGELDLLVVGLPQSSLR